MLADCCPDCAVPLMQQRGSTTSSCVSCRQSFPVDGPPAIHSAASAAVQQPSAPEDSHVAATSSLANLHIELPSLAGGSNALGLLSSISSDAGVNLPPYPSLPPISTTSAEPSAETPLRAAEVGLEELDTASFRQRELQLDAQRLAALSEITGQGVSHTFVEDVHGGEAWPTASSMPGAAGNQIRGVEARTSSGAASAAFQAESRSFGTQTSPHRASQRHPEAESPVSSEEAFKWPYGNRQSEDASKEIADKLLQGWTLLAEHCPRCLNPLLADRGDKIFCPGCKLWVVHADDSAVRSSAAPEAAAQDATSVPATTGSQEAAGSRVDARGARLEAREASRAGLGVAPELYLQHDIGARAETSGHGAGLAQAEEQEAETSARAASRTILAKLQEAEEALSKTPVSNAETCKQLLGLIKKCCSTLKALGRL